MTSLKEVFSEDQIRNRVHEMASQVSRDYGEELVHVVGILDSSFVFMADLVRNLTCPVVCRFVKMETRDTMMEAQAFRSIVYSQVNDVEGKNILLVDALVETGITVDHLVQQLLLKKPKSVRTAALIDRENRRRISFRADYAGFSWDGGGHLVGYGLDKDGLYRNLPYVAAITPAANGAQGEAKKGGTVTQ